MWKWKSKMNDKPVSMCRQVKRTLLKFITHINNTTMGNYYIAKINIIEPCLKCFCNWNGVQLDGISKVDSKTLLECVSLGSDRDISEHTCARDERCVITAEVCREPETFVPPLSANFSRLFVPICSLFSLLTNLSYYNQFS